MAKGRGKNPARNDPDSNVVARLGNVETVLARLCELNTIDTVLQTGFEHVVSQLAPLRRLAPEYPSLEEDEYKRLRNLVYALKRPNFKGVAALSIKEAAVPFIGEKWPPPIYEKGGSAP